MITQKQRADFSSIVMIVLLLGCSQHYEEGAHPPPRIPKKILSQKGHLQVQKKIEGDINGRVSGMIRISLDLASKIPDKAYLFIIARERSDGGPPYALKRMRVPKFPFKYTLTQADVGMMFGEGIVLAEIPEMYLVAKIDQDGFVGKQPGDMEGRCLDNPVAAGQSDRDILIDIVH